MPIPRHREAKGKKRTGSQACGLRPRLKSIRTRAVLVAAYYLRRREAVAPRPTTSRPALVGSGTLPFTMLKLKAGELSGSPVLPILPVMVATAPETLPAAMVGVAPAARPVSVSRAAVKVVPAELAIVSP